jgi:hypothetical protein
MQGRYSPCGFGKPIAAQYGADDQRDELLRGLPNRSSTVQAEPKIATCGCLNLIENNAVEQIHAWKALVEYHLFCRQCTREQPASQRVRLTHPADDPFLHRLPDGRHTNHERRLESAQITVAMSNRIVSECPRTAIS